MKVLEYKNLTYTKKFSKKIQNMSFILLEYLLSVVSLS